MLYLAHFQNTLVHLWFIPSPMIHISAGRSLVFSILKRFYFEKIASGVGLIQRNKNLYYWCRHPLAFLVEAADDICYTIIDIEDGFGLGYLTFEEAKDLLFPIAKGANISSSMAKPEIIGKLRAVAIGELINKASEAFQINEDALLRGTYENELIADTPYKSNIERAKSIAREKIYCSERKTIIAIAGSEIISGLLDLFLPVVSEFEHVGWDIEKLSSRQQMLARLIPNQFIGVTSRYQTWLRITDFISGMTDRFALDLYRKLKGIAI